MVTVTRTRLAGDGQVPVQWLVSGLVLQVCHNHHEALRVVQVRRGTWGTRDKRRSVVRGQW